MRPLCSRTAALVVLAASASLVAPGSACSADATGARPGFGAAPDEVTVGVGLLDIVEIDNQAQTFSADIYLQVQWRDPRLAIRDGDSEGSRTFAASEIWTPGLTVINDRGMNLLFPEVASVDPDGNVMLRQRLAGPLAVDLDLYDFPFDTQRLPIEIVSYRHTPDEVVFSESSELVMRRDDLDGDGWSYVPLEPEFSVYRLSNSGPGRSKLTLAVMATRESGYYVLTLALPMTLIMFLAWMVHWLPPDLVPARMGMASATVFSLIALGVSFRLTLPEIAYLTAADRFVLHSTLLVIASLAVTVASVRWVNSDRNETAARLTKTARAVFPALYVTVVLIFTT